MTRREKKTMKRTETGTERGTKKENSTQSEQVFISIPL